MGEPRGRCVVEVVIEIEALDWHRAAKVISDLMAFTDAYELGPAEGVSFDVQGVREAGGREFMKLASLRKEGVGGSGV
jgi:hypothetical protein